MGIHRTPEELKSIIRSGTMHLVAMGGMSNFSFPKLSAETGISAPTVYKHYENKEVLLTTCFMMIDREISDMVARFVKKIPYDVEDIVSLENHCRLLWLSYWKYLLSDSDRTRFYWNYFNSSSYNSEISKQRRENFSEFLRFIQGMNERFPMSDNCDLNMLSVNLIEGTVSAAVKVLRGVYKNDEVTMNTVYHMMFRPIFFVSLSDMTEADERKAISQ